MSLINNFNVLSSKEECRSYLMDVFASQGFSNGLIKDFSGSNTKKDNMLKDINQVNVLLNETRKIVLVAENSYNWIIVFMCCVLFDREIYIIDNNASVSAVEDKVKAIKPDIVITGNKDYKSAYTASVNIDDIFNSDDYIKIKGTAEVNDSKVILYTTGTTGTSKGVIISVKNIVNGIISFSNIIKAANKDNVLLISPFSHAMGLSMMLLSVLFANETYIAKNQLQILHGILNENATIIAMPPTMLAMLKDKKDYINKLSQMRLVIVGGAGADTQMFSYYLSKGVSLINGYGMTECTTFVAISDVDNIQQDKLMNPLNNCEFSISPAGEILIKGVTVCDYYTTGEKIVSDDGWYHTKDAGQINNGKIEVLHRIDSVKVLQSGYKINLETMEHTINRLPEILDCQVFIEKNKNYDVIRVDVVLVNNVHFDAESLKKKINKILEYYEQVQKVNICAALNISGGKKKRNE